MLGWLDIYLVLLHNLIMIFGLFLFHFVYGIRDFLFLPILANEIEKEHPPLFLIGLSELNLLLVTEIRLTVFQTFYFFKEVFCIVFDVHELTLDSYETKGVFIL